MNDFGLVTFMSEAIVVTPECTNRMLSKRFETEHAECAVVVNSNNHPLGLIMKYRFFRYLGSLYGSSLYYERPAALLMERSPLIVEMSTPAQSAIDRALNRDEEHLYDCVVVTEKGELRGILTVRNLLNASTYLQKQAMASQKKLIDHMTNMMVRIEESIKQVMSSANIGLGISDAMLGLTFDGRKQLSQVLQAFSQNQEMMVRLEKQVLDLKQQSLQISAIVKSIRDIADHSNLLALNAAVEAARSGEQGKGFTVVANEVRSMAGTTKLSASEISEIAGKIAGAVERIVKTVEQSRNDVSQSATIVENTSQVFEKLFLSATENRASSEQIEQLTTGANVELTQVLQSIEQLQDETRRKVTAHSAL